MRDLRGAADELARERLEPRLNAGRRRFLRSGLLFGCGVSEAAEHEPKIRRLLPVVVAVTRVMRAGEVLVAERLRDDHLPARRLHGAIEHLEEAVRIAVGRQHDLVGVQLLERRYGIVLADLGSRLRCLNGEPAHPTRRLN